MSVIRNVKSRQVARQRCDAATLQHFGVSSNSKAVRTQSQRPALPARNVYAEFRNVNWCLDYCEGEFCEALRAALCQAPLLGGCNTRVPRRDRTSPPLGDAIVGSWAAACRAKRLDGRGLLSRSFSGDRGRGDLVPWLGSIRLRAEVPCIARSAGVGILA